MAGTGIGIHSAEGTRTFEPDSARGGWGRPRIGRSRPWAAGTERVRPNMAVLR